MPMLQFKLLCRWFYNYYLLSDFLTSVQGIKTKPDPQKIVKAFMHMCVTANYPYLLNLYISIRILFASTIALPIHKWNALEVSAIKISDRLCTVRTFVYLLLIHVCGRRNNSSLDTLIYLESLERNLHVEWALSKSGTSSTPILI